MFPKMDVPALKQQEHSLQKHDITVYPVEVGFICIFSLMLATFKHAPKMHYVFF